MAILYPLATVAYSSSDGLPMAESNFQHRAAVWNVRRNK
jgi:hypothetical protein